MGGSLFTTSVSGKGKTKERALDDLLNQFEPNSYQIKSSDGMIRYKEVTPGYYETNVITYDSNGTGHRAIINRLMNANNHHYFRAWFGEIYD